VRIALGLQYNGAAFSGWQSQSHGHTVQDTLENALEKLTSEHIRTIAAGRTDAGVHALGQVVHFDSALTRPLSSWIQGVNAFLPPTVAVQWAQPVADDFHARFSAFERTYYYLLYVHRIRAPLLTGRTGWLYGALDIAAMRTATVLMIGEHDFSAFRATACQAKSPVKQLYAIDIETRGDLVYFRFRANAFLHHMVRNILACLIAIGHHKRPIHWLVDVLHTRDRRMAMPTFMPDGLYLAHIRYPDRFALPMRNPSLPWTEGLF
jgi:tRNA pseudouridine38-40 synthase